MKRFILIGLTGLSLAACDTEPTRDVQYYLDHKEERTAKLTECLNNPGEKSTPQTARTRSLQSKKR